MEEKHRVTLKIKWPIMAIGGFVSASVMFGCEAYQPPAPVQQDMTVTTLAAYDPVHPFSDLPTVTGSGREVTVDGLLFPGQQRRRECRLYAAGSTRKRQLPNNLFRLCVKSAAAR